MRNMYQHIHNIIIVS